MTTSKMESRPAVAIVQHPMWLIIKEDFLCAERDGEWGLGSIMGYAGRLARNLEILESNPNLKLNFDFSSAELEDVKAMYPDLAERLVAVTRRGQVGFVDGAYSQANLQYHSLEGSIRQMEWGVRSIKGHFGYDVRTFAFQDTGYTDQTPQILKAFGFRYVSYIHWTNCVTQQPLLDDRLTGDEAFCLWTGLDGTSILAGQYGAGVRIEYPDMTEYPDDPQSDFVILDEYFTRKDRLDRGPRPHVRIPYNGSYLEGTGAEELSRLNSDAETALIQLETLAALIKPDKRQMSAQPLLNELWRIWLTAQHHDGYWTGGPGLRTKACAWLKNVIQTSFENSLAMLKTAFPDRPGGKKSLVCFAVYPKKHIGIMTVPWPTVPPDHLITPEGKKIPAQIVPCGPHKGNLFVPFDFTGAGYRELFPCGENLNPVKPETITSVWQFKNPYYSATFLPDGSIKTLHTAKGTDVLHSKTPTGSITASFDSTRTHCITDWHIVGPFFSPKKGQINLDMPTPVEKGFAELGEGMVDLKAKYSAGAETRRWKPVKTNTGDIVDFDERLGRFEWACAYGFAVLQWPCDEKVTFRFGSDDGIKVWLNGQVVHVNEICRSATTVDFVELPLRKGANYFLLKIDNYEQGWGFTVWTTTPPGPVEKFESSIKDARLWRGPVADVLESVGSLGPVPVTRRLIAYHDLPWFEMEIECEFNQTRIGEFWDDTRKFVMQWPVGEKTSMQQGIGGGSIVPDGPTRVLAQPGRVILPVNWLDLEQNAAGVALINFGVLKYCHKDDTLYSVLAWGDHTTNFCNRDPRCGMSWGKKLDLRLNGKHIFRFAIYPHDGDWQTARVPDLAMSLLRPPVGIQRLSDGKPESKTLLSVESDLIPTAVFSDGQDLTCRVYEPYGKPQKAVVNYRGKSISPRICDVANHPTEGIRPWQIANLTLTQK